MESISSAQNPKIKLLLELQQKSAERQKHDLFVVEGERELKRCIQNGYEVESVFFCRDIICKGLETFMADSDGVALYEVSKQVYEKIAYRGGTEGVIAEVKTRHYTLDSLKLSERPLIIVLESVEKPGNLGAVLRSADAAKAAEVFAPGDQVSHKTFGPGVVTAVDGDAIEVHFTRTGKTKKLLKGFAPIVKIKG